MREVIKCSVGKKKGLAAKHQGISMDFQTEDQPSDVVAEERGERGCGCSGNIQFSEFFLLAVVVVTH